MSELTYEKIANAIKATDYKYFGDYELSDKQREAVETLADAAVELMSFIERSDRAPQSEWVSVDDRLPDADMQVLITDKEYVGHARLRSNLIGDRFQIVGLNHYEPISNVTHWMPIPNPPEAK